MLTYSKSDASWDEKQDNVKWMTSWSAWIDSPTSKYVDIKLVIFWNAIQDWNVRDRLLTKEFFHFPHLRDLIKLSIEHRHSLDRNSLISWSEDINSFNKQSFYV